MGAPSKSSMMCENGLLPLLTLVSLATVVAILDAVGLDGVENVLFWASPIIVDLSCIVCSLISWIVGSLIRSTGPAGVILTILLPGSHSPDRVFPSHDPQGKVSYVSAGRRYSLTRSRAGEIPRRSGSSRGNGCSTSGDPFPH